jgi:hypothetical protein
MRDGGDCATRERNSNASEARRDAGVSVAGAAGGCGEADGNTLGSESGHSCRVKS